MSRVLLPPGLVPMGKTEIFTQETLLPALLESHALAAGRWGVLHLHEGEVTFVDLENQEHYLLTAPDAWVIEPEKRHKLNQTDALVLHIDFFTDKPEGSTRILEDDAVWESFNRMEATGDFAATFYEQFLDSSPDIAPYFVNTNFSKQRKLLRGSVYMMVTRDVSDPKMRVQLDRVALSHSRRGAWPIPPRFYWFWLNSLCATVKALDPEWTPILDKRWRERMQDGIQVITSQF